MTDEQRDALLARLSPAGADEPYSPPAPRDGPHARRAPLPAAPRTLSLEELEELAARGLEESLHRRARARRRERAGLLVELVLFAALLAVVLAALSG